MEVSMGMYGNIIELLLVDFPASHGADYDELDTEILL
jgi:hypothetical protein